MRFENIEKISTLHPLIRKYAHKLICQVEDELGIELIITHAFRTFEEQEVIYNKGRIFSGKIFSFAKPGESYHNYGLAFDIKPYDYENISEFPYWENIGEIGKTIGLEWGGDFKCFYDKRHFQKRFGVHHSGMLKLQKNNKLKNGYIII